MQETTAMYSADIESHVSRAIFSYARSQSVSALDLAILYAAGISRYPSIERLVDSVISDSCCTRGISLSRESHTAEVVKQSVDALLGKGLLQIASTQSLGRIIARIKKSELPSDHVFLPKAGDIVPSSAGVVICRETERLISHFPGFSELNVTCDVDSDVVTIRAGSINALLHWNKTSGMIQSEFFIQQVQIKGPYWRRWWQIMPFAFEYSTSSGMRKTVIH